MPPEVITRRLSLTTLSSDILSEILSYFRYDITHGISQWPDEVEEYWQTRMTALAVARVSRILSPIALDVLWRDMLSLQPVLKVIEASASSPIFLFRPSTDDSGMGYWERQEEYPNFDKLLPRVESYLSRIRRVEIFNPSAKEYSLWSILMSYLKRNGPLLPELQLLRVQWDDVILPPIYPTLIPLVSPTLQKLELFSDNEDFYGDPILHHLRLMGGNICSLSLTGYSQKSLLPVLRSFSSLRSLWLQYLEGEQLMKRAFSPQELLLSVPALHNLNIDLRGVHLNPGQPPVGAEIVLKSLDVAGPPQDIIRFFEKDIMSSSIMELNIFILGHRISLRWKDMFGAIAHAFPNLRQLYFDHSRIEGAPSLAIGDLAQLFGRSLTHLTLPRIKYSFSSEDVSSILKAWTSLQSLDFGPGTIFDATALEYIAAHALLKSIVLSVDLMGFLDPVTSAAGLAKKLTHKQCHLTELLIRNPPVLPLAFEQKVALVRNLLALFPRLERLGFLSHSAHGEIEKELCILLSTFRTVY